MKEEAFDFSGMTMEDYVRIVSKNTEFFSTSSADILMKNLIHYAQDQGFNVKLAKDKFKVKIQILLDGGVEAGENVEVTARILKVNDQKVCVEFGKNGGTDSLVFFN